MDDLASLDIVGDNDLYVGNLSVDANAIATHPVAPARTISRRVQKLILDYGLTLTALAIFGFPMVLVAILIKLDSPGPVFFRQPRIGLHGKRFFIWKFRTMYADNTDIGGVQLTQRGDSRVTPIGAVLRRTSFDELPQLFNVLVRHMSLVGPRPHPLYAKAGELCYEDAVSHYHRRHAVLPGITGFAQVNGWRGDTDTIHKIEQRVKYDLMYIERWSLLLDIKIILLTLREPLRQHVH